jgi:hypothetical protein
MTIFLLFVCLLCALKLGLLCNERKSLTTTGHPTLLGVTRMGTHSLTSLLLHTHSHTHTTHTNTTLGHSLSLADLTVSSQSTSRSRKSALTLTIRVIGLKALYQPLTTVGVVQFSLLWFGCQRQTHVTTDGQSASHSWCQAPSGAQDQNLLLLTLTQT